MTLDEIRRTVANIKVLSGDPESAHSMEDQLYADFVEYVALFGPLGLAEMAREVLRTEDIEFPRWCA